MNVRELIEKLQGLPQDMEVWAWVDHEREPVSDAFVTEPGDFLLAGVSKTAVVIFAPDPDLDGDG